MYRNNNTRIDNKYIFVVATNCRCGAINNIYSILKLKYKDAQIYYIQCHY